MAEVAIGSEFAGHRIEGIAGRGGMGVVYRATHLALNRPVALKLITPELAEDDAFRERFKHESMTAASIDHPHVIPIYHAGEEEGKLYITMRFVDGTDLRAMIAEKGKLDAGLAAQIVSQVAAALDAAHARGLVHRDVKPANVLISGSDQRHAYLTDFGLTKHAASQSGLTKTGMFVGTLDYIAPEQLQAQSVDGRADVYALGCVLYQSLTGNVPFPRETEPAKIWAHMSEPPPSIIQAAKDVPPQFEDVVRRAMAKDPNDRYLSAGDLGRAGLAAAESRSVTRAERSVATGDAAPSAATAVAPPAAGQPPAGQPPTYVQPPAATPPTGPGTAPGGAPPAGVPPTGAAWQPPGAPPQQPPPYQPPPAGYQGPPPGGPPKRGGLPLPALIGAGVAGLAILVAVLAVAGVFGGGGSGKKKPPPPPAVLPASIRVGSNPNGIAFAGDSAWVTNQGDGTVTRILQQTGKVFGAPIHVGGGPTAIAFGDGFLWVSNFDDGTVVKLDPKTGQLSGAPIQVGGSPENVVEGGGNVYVARFSGKLAKLSAASGQKLAESPTSSDFEGMALDGASLWVADDKNGGVSRFDANSLQPTTAIKTGQATYGVAVGFAKAWAANFVDSTVTKIDTASNGKVGDVPNVGSAQDANGMAIGLGAVWVVDQDANQVDRIDPNTDAVTKFPTAKKPQAVGIGAGHVWVVNADAGTVTTIKPPQ